MLVSIVYADGLVRQHQAISINIMTQYLIFESGYKTHGNF